MGAQSIYRRAARNARSILLPIPAELSRLTAINPEVGDFSLAPLSPHTVSRPSEVPLCEVDLRKIRRSSY
jgi:hypothetical protein